MSGSRSSRPCSSTRAASSRRRGASCGRRGAASPSGTPVCIHGAVVARRDCCGGSIVAFAALQRRRTRKPRQRNGLYARSRPKRSRSPDAPEARVAARGRERGPPRADHTPRRKRDRHPPRRWPASDIVPNGEPIPSVTCSRPSSSPDGSTIITGARNGTIRLWDADSGEATRPSRACGRRRGGRDRSERPLARGSRRGGAWRWDLDDGQPGRGRGRVRRRAVVRGVLRGRHAPRDRPPRTASCRLRHRPWTEVGEPFTEDVDFLSVAFTLDGTRVLAGTGGGRLFIWDAVTGKPAAGSPIAAHGTNDVWEVVPHPDGDLVATARQRRHSTRCGHSARARFCDTVRGP